MTKKLIINLVEKLDEVSPEQACRTCTHSSSRTWHLTLDKMLELQGAGESLSEFACRPGEYMTTKGVKDRKVTTIPKNKPDQRYDAKVHTCGQVLKPKCAVCRNLNRVTISVPYTTYEGGPTRYSEVLVGGTCKIPAKHDIESFTARAKEYEAIEVYPMAEYFYNLAAGLRNRVPLDDAGNEKYCDFQPRQTLNIAPSCLNCRFLMQTNDSRLIDPFAMQVGRTDLTPYEMEMARRYAADHQINVGYAINLFRSHLLNNTAGVWRFYGATLVETHSEFMMTLVNGKRQLRDTVTGHTVRLAGSGDQLTVTVDDDLIHVIVVDDSYCVVQVMDPYHRELGFPDAVRRRQRLFPTLAELPNELGNRMGWFVEPGCSQCRPGRACYYHAKRPVFKPLLDEVEFQYPEGANTYPVDRPECQLTLRREGEYVTVLDANNDAPNASVFRQNLLRLLDECRSAAERKQVMQQWSKALDGLELSAPREVQIGYPNATQLDPFKSHCSHPRGIDFREVFGDTFGVSNPDSWSAKDGREAWLRASVSERQFSPMQAYLEDMANLALAEDQAERRPSVEHVPFEQYFVTQLDPWGAETVRSEDGRAAERAAYRDWLDEQTVLRRDEDAVEVTNMQRLYGVSIVMGSHAATEPSWLFDRADDLGDDHKELREVAYFVCVRDPEHRFTPEAIDDDHRESLLCPTCEGEIFWYEAHHEDLPARLPANRRGRNGIGYGVAMDREHHLEQGRLLQLCCDNWELNGSSSRKPITIDSLRRK